MKPNKAGIWEWFDKDGYLRLVEVFDVNAPHPMLEPYFRVYWWGGYYNIDGDPFEENGPDEWPNRWGNFVGEHGSVPEEKLYNMPTERERAEIFKKLQH